MYTTLRWDIGGKPTPDVVIQFKSYTLTPQHRQPTSVKNRTAPKKPKREKGKKLGPGLRGIQMHFVDNTGPSDRLKEYKTDGKV